jgi:hypothetical protein
MNNQIIKQLENIKDANTDKLVALISSKQPVCPPDLYSKSVFESQAKYDLDADYFDCQIVGKYASLLWNNSLVFDGGNNAKVLASAKDQGIALGIVMLDYKTKKVQIAVVVDKDGTKYSYTATVYNETTKVYETAVVKETCADMKALLSFFSTKLGLDIAKFND